jgi:hypothetical protein
MVSLKHQPSVINEEIPLEMGEKAQLSEEEALVTC